VHLAPISAVQDDGDGERAALARVQEIGELVEVGSISVTHTMARRMAQAPATWILTGSPERFAAGRAAASRAIGPA